MGIMLSWEVALTFRQLTGKPQLIQCRGCLEERTGGSPDERSASGRVLDVVYLDVTSNEPVFYCEACAAKHVEGIDPTRSITQFYADTRGTSF